MTNKIEGAENKKKHARALYFKGRAYYVRKTFDINYLILPKNMHLRRR